MRILSKQLHYHPRHARRLLSSFRPRILVAVSRIGICLPSRARWRGDSILALKILGMIDFVGRDNLVSLSLSQIKKTDALDGIKTIVSFAALDSDVSAILANRGIECVPVLSNQLPHSPIWLLRERKLSRSSDAIVSTDWRDDSDATFLPLRRSDWQHVSGRSNSFLAPQAPEIVAYALGNARAVRTERREILDVAASLGGRTQLRFDPDGRKKRAREWFATKLCVEPGAVPRGERVRLCLIASEKYLCELSGLIENFIAIHGGNFHVVLLALDVPTRQFAVSRYEKFIDRVYNLSDLWSPREHSRLRERSLSQQAYSSKGRLLKKALERWTDCLYTDLDIYFYRSPARLFRSLSSEGGGALLFPHWNRSYVNARRHGTYNAGLIAVNRLALRFLDWWSSLCLERCEKSPSLGHYDDQAYLDLAAVCFPEVKSYRGADENIGGWAIDTLGIEATPLPGGLTLPDGRLIGSFHATHDDAPGYFEEKFAWDHMVANLLFPDMATGCGNGSTPWTIRCRYQSSVARLHQIYQAIGNRIGIPSLRFPQHVESFLVGKGSPLTRPWPKVRALWHKDVERLESGAWRRLQRDVVIGSPQRGAT